MPTYDYRCKSCGDTFEHFQQMSDPKLRKCTNCGRHTLERLIGSGAGIIFRGTGFYETDYKRRGNHGKGDSHSKGETKRPSDGEE